MKKILILLTLLLTISFTQNVHAYRVDLTSHEGKSGGAWVDITYGTNQVNFDLGLSTGTIADMRGFFFDLGDSSSISKIEVNSLIDMENVFTTDSVITSWPDVSGSAGMQGAGDFDIGIEFGKQGIGNNKGDIRAINLTIFGDELKLGDDFGMRLMSFGDNRGDSRKMISSGPAPVPEPATMFLLGSGLMGLGWTRRKKKNS